MHAGTNSTRKNTFFPKSNEMSRQETSLWGPIRMLWQDKSMPVSGLKQCFWLSKDINNGRILKPTHATGCISITYRLLHFQRIYDGCKFVCLHANYQQDGCQNNFQCIDKRTTNLKHSRSGWYWISVADTTCLMDVIMWIEVMLSFNKRINDI